MNVTTALHTRRSIRAFTDRPLERALITEILDAARHAPSGANMQPWEVGVVTGATKARLDAALEAAFRSGAPLEPAFDYYPKTWIEPFSGRRKACGLQMYQALSIRKGDREGQADQWAANFRAFDAPAVLYLWIDATLSPGSLIDCGIFLQSVMLAATERGVSTCPQVAPAEYGSVVQSVLGLPESKRVIVAVAMGYEARDAAVNGYRTDRECVEAFTRFFD
jgi:nitroreductase